MIYILVAIYILAGVSTAIDGLESDRTSVGINKTSEALGVAGDLPTPYLNNKLAAIIIVTFMWPILAVAGIYRELTNATINIHS